MKFPFSPWAILLCILVFSCTKIVLPPNEPGVSLELATFRKSLLSDIHYKLYFQIPKDENLPIPATITINFCLTTSDVDLPLDFRESGENLKSLVINDFPTDIVLENEHILLPARFLKKGLNKITLAFNAGSSSLNRNPDYLFTLFVPDRARTAFPLFDQPDLKAIYELTLEIPNSWKAIANAPLSSEIIGDNSRIVYFAPSDPISSYLFSFVAGDFKTITRELNGREMTLLHRETDTVKVERNLSAIFELHAASLRWLEEYTAIPYPFQKFDFALIPAFPYGGMEHVGAIQYNAASLFLDEDPSDTQLLSRASLIAHETAHMWFGNLVTMEWFNDVWTKEVFANFMAAKIVNPNFPEINHNLNFLRHYAESYSVDRTAGANPIRQYLGNLNEAGQMYGSIIYNKAPIMMRQLELITGEDAFRDGMREYLSTYANKNATWPDLVEILDRKSDFDIEAWSQVWVNSSGRPVFSQMANANNQSPVLQTDPSGEEKIWSQKFTVLENSGSVFIPHELIINGKQTNIHYRDKPNFIFNSDGYGYGLFPATLEHLLQWESLDDVTKGSLLINLYENMLEQHKVLPADYFRELLRIIQHEKNQLVLNKVLGQLQTIYWNLFTEHQRQAMGFILEDALWDQVRKQPESSIKKIFFTNFRSISLSPEHVQKVYDIWNGDNTIDGLNLSESDYASMAFDLAIKRPQDAIGILHAQLENIKDTDRKRRFEFIMPALVAEQEVRDGFFESLKEEKNRQTESWVLSALGYLHHPLRTQVSEKYLMPSLELLQEIQVTGDIFFPKNWLDATLNNYNSETAVKTVRKFLEKQPEYNPQLKMKILQASDMLFRANAIQKQQKD